LSASEPITSQSNSAPAFVVAVILEAPDTTWSLVRMMPRASMMTPEPSDWLVRRRARGSPPKKKSSKSEGRRRWICSAEMLTTEGATFSTTPTISLRRVGRGDDGEGAATSAAARAAAMRIPGRGGRRSCLIGCAC
jgi:hypothetical protein